MQREACPPKKHILPQTHTHTHTKTDPHVQGPLQISYLAAKECGILHTYPLIERVYREDKIEKMVARGKWQFAAVMIEGLKERRERRRREGRLGHTHTHTKLEEGEEGKEQTHAHTHARAKVEDEGKGHTHIHTHAQTQMRKKWMKTNNSSTTSPPALSVHCASTTRALSKSSLSQGGIWCARRGGGTKC